jgi:3-oxoacyl-[acyl-carrier protein] reductase
MSAQPARIVLITRASRGTGAQVAQQLAGPDTHVMLNYLEYAAPADAIAERIRHAGGHASTVAADISDEGAAEAMIGSVAARFGRLDALVLNASGGHEVRHLARLALPLMPAGGRIVFVTSHQAHFFPNKAVPKGYSAIAASKRAGETALYAMRTEFHHAGVHLSVVSGDLIDGNIVAVDEFADAIVSATNAPSPRSIAYVGGPNYVMAA